MGWETLWICVFLFATWYALTTKGWVLYAYLAILACWLVYGAVNMVRGLASLARDLVRHPIRTLFSIACTITFSLMVLYLLAYVINNGGPMRLLLRIF